LPPRAKEKNKDYRESKKLFSESIYLHFIIACETVTVAARRKAGLVWALSNYDNERFSTGPYCRRTPKIREELPLL